MGGREEEGIDWRENVGKGWVKGGREGGEKEGIERYSSAGGLNDRLRYR